MLDRHGKITGGVAARIESASKSYGEALRAQKRLADAEAGTIALSESELQGWSDRLVRHLACRDRIMASLDLDRQADPWELFYKQAPQLPLGPPAPITKPTSPTPASAEVAPQASVDVPLGNGDLEDK